MITVKLLIVILVWLGAFAVAIVGIPFTFLSGGATIGDLIRAGGDWCADCGVAAPGRASVDAGLRQDAFGQAILLTGHLERPTNIEWQVSDAVAKGQQLLEGG